MERREKDRKQSLFERIFLRIFTSKFPSRKLLEKRRNKFSGTGEKERRITPKRNVKLRGLRLEKFTKLYKIFLFFQNIERTFQVKKYIFRNQPQNSWDYLSSLFRKNRKISVENFFK